MRTTWHPSTRCVLFCPALAGSHPLASDDGLPDEVCGPAESESDLGLRSARRRIELAKPIAFGFDRSIMVRSSAQGSSSRLHARATSSRTDDLITLLCRLNC